MTDGTFRKKLVKTFKDLGIDANKITHFGRDVAPAIMDMREVVTDDQKILVIGRVMFFKMYTALTYHYPP